MRLAALINRRAGLLPAVLFVAACSTPQGPLRSLDPLTEIRPMIATEAYRDDRNFYVKFSQGGEEYFAGGNWRDRIELRPEGNLEESEYPSIVAIEYRQREPWAQLPDDVLRLPVFGVEQWRRLNERLLDATVPASGGLAIDFGPVEYFLYRDTLAQVVMTRIEQRPPEMQILARMSLQEFLHAGRDLLDAFLEDSAVDSSEFVFNTGDSGLYSLPFFYVNSSLGVAAFVRNQPSQPFVDNGIPGLKSAQAFGHVMRSHLTSLVLRPVSSLYRLVFVVSDAAIGTVSFDWVTALADKPVGPVKPEPPMDLDLWEAELDRISNRRSSSGSVEVLVDGENFFPRFADQVAAADESIRLQTYIFDNDDFAVEIGDLLKRRSRDGVDVRVLLDGLGTIGGTMSNSVTQPTDHEPPESVRLFLESDSNVVVRQKPNPWFTGDHVKSTIIDDRLAFVGGMNIGREYRHDWHDLMVESRGPVVRDIAQEFDAAWAHAGLLGDLGYVIARNRNTPVIEGEGELRLRLLLTEPGNYEIFNAQREAIRRARNHIYIQNAYFTDDRLLRELVMARRRGVDVRVIIPLETDHGPIDRSNVLAANLMLSQGIRVYIYPGFSHVKAAIYDGWVCLGSANFDRWSLRLNRELNIASSAPALAQQLRERLFEPDFAVSPELTEPFPEHWLDHLAEIVADYIF